MDLIDIFEFISSLQFGQFAIVASLLGCVAVAVCICLYTAICSALDGLKEMRSRRAERESWFAEQARIHRESKSG
jgi:hypothetical protein